jgi:hypothetical protein
MIKIALLSTLALTPANTAKAEQAARDWVSIYLRGATIVTQPNCESWDTNDNGMVRCNLSYRDEQGTAPLSLECPSAWIFQFTSECHTMRRY